ncbi:hypothetical protein VKT23_003038 [Stygiomarasmius scandens]|uniref:Uncharacterized protein n=1 Tax=Marasmiellus scandens TaxID=2682957 RepID=A0ABR1JXS5_9AGAR
MPSTQTTTAITPEHSKVPAPAVRLNDASEKAGTAKVIETNDSEAPAKKKGSKEAKTAPGDRNIEKTKGGKARKGAQNTSPDGTINNTQVRPKQVKGSKKGTATAADKEFDILADITNAYHGAAIHRQGVVQH